MLPSSAAPPRSIEHWVEAARACAESPARSGLDGDALLAWPEWALPAQRGTLDLRVLCAGALRHADALAACIDGPLLQAASELLGPERLHALLHGRAPRVPQLAALPGADTLASAWRASGRALLLASIEPARLRAALAAHLVWPDTIAADIAPADAAAAVAWALDAAPDDEASRAA